MPVRCPWRRLQVRADHGEVRPYGRRCALAAGHDGPHEVPARAKQANGGVWFDPEQGETFTQDEEEA